MFRDCGVCPLYEGFQRSIGIGDGSCMGYEGTAAIAGSAGYCCTIFGSGLCLQYAVLWQVTLLAMVVREWVLNFGCAWLFWELIAAMNHDHGMELDLGDQAGACRRRALRT